MRDFVIKCDACKKEILPEENKPVVFHDLKLKFQTFMIDPHTHQEEEMTNMHRITKNTYCRNCLEALVNKMNEFLEEVAPEPREIVEEFNEKVNKLQSNKIDGKAAMEKR